MQKVAALTALALTLGACAPTLSEATLSLSPSTLHLRRGQSATVTVWFKKYVFEGEQQGGYRLNVFAGTARGLRALVFKDDLKATDSATIQITAAQNADLGRQSVPVVVSDRRGHNLGQTLTVQVRE